MLYLVFPHFIPHLFRIYLCKNAEGQIIDPEHPRKMRKGSRAPVWVRVQSNDAEEGVEQGHNHGYVQKRGNAEGTCKNHPEQAYNTWDACIRTRGAYLSGAHGSHQKYLALRGQFHRKRQYFHCPSMSSAFFALKLRRDMDHT